MRVDWTREFRYNTMHTSIELKRWYVLCTSRGRNVTDAFIGALQKAGSGMSMKIAPPRMWVKIPLLESMIHNNST